MVGSYGQGLAKLDKATGKCEHFQQINNPIVYSIAEDKKKNLFFGVFGSGFISITCSLENWSIMNPPKMKKAT